MKNYSPIQDEPKTVQDYIKWGAFWLSGDSGWREEDIVKFLEEFRDVVIHEWSIETNDE